jgi:hypothetical protein
MKKTMIVLGLAALLLLIGVTAAMAANGYRLDWFTPLTSSGGGAAHSTHYAVNFTVGQSAIGASAGRNFGSYLGYWCERVVALAYRTFLPVLLRNYR